MASILSYGKYFQFALNNADLVAEAADVAVAIKAAPTYVEKVAILNPFLERVAPKADELKKLIAGETKVRSTHTTDELRSIILKKIEALPAPREAADGTTSIRPRRDGKWLDAGIEIFRLFVLPLLLDQLRK